jgi:hypothetical protein
LPRVSRHWLHEAALAPAAAFPGDGEQCAELAEAAVRR